CAMCGASSLIFFFQAEDGIRDGHVTGVQTCALPISGRTPNDCRNLELYVGTQSFGAAYPFPLEPFSSAAAHNRTRRHSSFRMSGLERRAGSSGNELARVPDH